MEQLKVEKTASRGIAIAKAYLCCEPDLSPDPALIGGTAEEEMQKFRSAREAVLEELRELAFENEIFSAHLEMAGDFTLQEGIENKITLEKKNAQMAAAEMIEEFAALFAAMDDVYMKEREADIRDIGKRLMAKLKNVIRPDLGKIKEETIIIAKDLYPSDTVKISTKVVKGILTEEGGITSHVSIIAKSLDIPILVGVKGILSKAVSGETLCMDAGKGIVVLQPEKETLKKFQERQQEEKKERERLVRLRDIPVVTGSGKRIFLCANVGGLDDIRKALEKKIDGVGLFRSEFLYMENTHFPTEEEQYQVYKEAAELCPQELTIRTLDIGGDKGLPYFDFGREDNPFLGWRAIRISLDQKEMFAEQLRAILRASAYGHVRILFPMVISLEELREAKEMVRESMSRLEEKNLPYDKKIEVGMMMETPASVLLAEEFAKEVDFFSIGTNDLTQYLLAVDRGNKKVADRYDYFHPAVKKAIGSIIKAGHDAGIPVGMCGEMAGDQRAVPMLLDMGLDEFSMSAGSIDYVREQILQS